MQRGEADVKESSKPRMGLIYTCFIYHYSSLIK